MNIRKKILGVVGLCIFLGVIVSISFIFIKRFGPMIESPDKVREIIGGYGVWAYLIYFLFYIFQIFFAPVPGQVLNVASGMLFGPFRGFLVSWGSVIAGGFLAMLVSRCLGKKILYWFLEEKALGFERELTRRGLAMIIFLAIFPNPIGDGLYYLAGLTAIPLKFLIGIIALCRIPGIAAYVFLGDRILKAGVKGGVIAGIGFLLAVVLYFLFKDKFERFFERMGTELLNLNLPSK